MEENKLYWKTALALLKEGSEVADFEIDFNEEQIPVKEVGVLNKYKIRVPEHLVFYDDNEIDCSDIPEITDEDIETGKIQWIETNEFCLDSDVRQRIVKNHINLNELIPQLRTSFYQSVKAIQIDLSH